MKKIIIATVLTLFVSVAFAQKVMDPSYAPGNYKHPNKAAYAKEHGLDNSTKLVNEERELVGNYKTPYDAKQIQVVALMISTPNSFASSSKHPQGLMNTRSKKGNGASSEGEFEVITLEENSVVRQP